MLVHPWATGTTDETRQPLFIQTRQSPASEAIPVLVHTLEIRRAHGLLNYHSLKHALRHPRSNPVQPPQADRMEYLTGLLVYPSPPMAVQHRTRIGGCPSQTRPSPPQPPTVSVHVLARLRAAWVPRAQALPRLSCLPLLTRPWPALHRRRTSSSCTRIPMPPPLRRNSSHSHRPHRASSSICNQGRQHHWPRRLLPLLTMLPVAQRHTSPCPRKRRHTRVPPNCVSRTSSLNANAVRR